MRHLSILSFRFYKTHGVPLIHLTFEPPLSILSFRFLARAKLDVNSLRYTFNSIVQIRVVYSEILWCLGRAFSFNSIVQIHGAEVHRADARPRVPFQFYRSDSWSSSEGC